MFGRVQAKLFPQYFATATAAIVLQIGTLAFGTPAGIARPQLITLGELLHCAKMSACRGHVFCSFRAMQVFVLAYLACYCLCCRTSEETHMICLLVMVP